MHCQNLVEKQVNLHFQIGFDDMRSQTAVLRSSSFWGNILVQLSYFWTKNANSRMAKKFKKLINHFICRSEHVIAVQVEHPAKRIQKLTQDCKIVFFYPFILVTFFVGALTHFQARICSRSPF